MPHRVESNSAAKPMTDVCMATSLSVEAGLINPRRISAVIRDTAREDLCNVKIMTKSIQYIFNGDEMRIVLSEIIVRHHLPLLALKTWKAQWPGICFPLWN